MEEDSENLPLILDGKFFKILKRQGSNVTARCVSCPNKELSGSTKASSNFLRHLKVISTYLKYLLYWNFNTTVHDIQNITNLHVYITIYQ